MPAYQFTVRIDPLALLTEGFVYEYDYPNTTEYVTPLGLETGGLVVGYGDFWHYVEVISNANWVDVDL